MIGDVLTIFAGIIGLLFNLSTWPCFFSSALSFGTAIITQLVGFEPRYQRWSELQGTFRLGLYIDIRA
jgi:hypothetical protein